MTSIESRNTIAEQMLHSNIHIAGIQETHIPRNQDYVTNGYRLITSDAIKIATGPQTGLSKGGVALLIHGQISKHIMHIRRINRRIITSTLHSTDTHPCHHNMLICAAQRLLKSRKQRTLGTNAKHTKKYTN